LRLIASSRIGDKPNLFVPVRDQTPPSAPTSGGVS